jgi:hypothetical protein
VFTNRYYNKYLEDDLCCMEERPALSTGRGKVFRFEGMVFDSEEREPAL